MRRKFFGFNLARGFARARKFARDFLVGGETRKYLVETFFVYGFISLSIFLIKILIARFYGQEALGVFTYFFSVVSLVYLFTSFGLPEALTQVIIKQPSRLKEVLKYFAGGTVISSVFFLFLTYLVLALPQFDPGISYFYWAVALYIIAYTFHYLTYSILRGRKAFVSASLYSLLNRIFLLVFLVGAFYFVLPFSVFLFSMSGALFIASVAALPSIWKRSVRKQGKNELVGGDNSSFSFLSPKAKAFFYLAFSLFLMQVSFYSLRFIDALTIKYLVDFAQLGLYSAYSSVTNLIRLLGYVFPMVVVPMAAVNHYKLRESLRRILYLLFPFVSLVLLAAYIAVPLLYGSEYQGGYLPVVLVLSSTLLIIYSYFNSIFVGENTFSREYLWILGIDTLLSLVLNSFLNILFITWWGIIGAPIATALTICLKIALNVYGIKKLRMKNHVKGEKVL